MALENEKTPIRVCSIEWSDCSVPVQKRDFWCRHLYLNAIRFAAARESARWSVHTHPIDKVFPERCLLTNFPVRWLGSNDLL